MPRWIWSPSSWRAARRHDSIGRSSTISGSPRRLPPRRTRARSAGSSRWSRRPRQGARFRTSRPPSPTRSMPSSASGPTPAEMERCLAQAESHFIYRLQTVGGFGGKSDQLNAYNVFLGDPDYFDKDLDRYRHVSAQAAAGRSGPASPSEPPHRAQRGPQGPDRTGARRVRPGLGVVMTVDRSRLPALGPEPTFAFPDIRRRVLANGLRVWTVEHRDVPVLNTLLLLPAGAADDPADRPGLAAITGDLLDEGSGSLNALEFHEALGRLGATIDTEVGSDATLLGITTLERFAERGLDLLADLVDTPPPGRTRVRARPRAAPQSSEAAARCAVSRCRARVRAAPLRRASLWAPVDRHRGLARRAHRRRCRFGFTTRDTIPASPRSSSSATGRTTVWPIWRTEPSASGKPRRTAGGRNDPIWLLPLPDDRLLLVHRPGAAQSELRIGHVSVTRSTPDYHALLTLNMIARRPVRQPDQHEPAREEGLHVRRAYELRRSPRSRTVRPAGKRAVGGHDRCHSRSDRRAPRHPGAIVRSRTRSCCSAAPR